VSFGALLRFDLAAQSWTAVAGSTPFPTEGGAAVVWTGQSVLIWGGVCGTQGACSIAESIDPASGNVKNLSLTGAPPFSYDGASVWTGTQMLVWTGAGSPGGMYDPVTDSWTTMSLPPVANATPNGPGFWTGSELLVWAYASQPGQTSSFMLPLAFDPKANAWTMLPTEGQPSSRSKYATVWTGSEMIIWGGTNSGDGNPLTDGAAYNPATQTWRTITPAPATGLDVTSAVWTGTEMLVWGGYSEYACGQDCVGSNYGYRYNPTTDAWQYITTANAPSARVENGAVWTGQSLVVWGGVSAFGGLNDGAVWSP
jgi:N-acetylneuraminic acid mutarotase